MVSWKTGDSAQLTDFALLPCLSVGWWLVSPADGVVDGMAAYTTAADIGPSQHECFLERHTGESALLAATQVQVHATRHSRPVAATQHTTTIHALARSRSKTENFNPSALQHSPRRRASPRIPLPAETS